MITKVFKKGTAFITYFEKVHEVYDGVFADFQKKNTKLFEVSAQNVSHVCFYCP